VPSKKQRRRRDKSRRHEYEYVVVDETGEELEVDPAELKKQTAPAAKRGIATRRRAGREVQPPSWQRVGKRALIFAPLMFVVVYLLGGAKLTVGQKLLQTIFLLAFFLPFSYLMDTFAYRAYRKRVDRA
jgi:cytochrome c-type biogenesis protein CcmH/NrfG